VGELLKEFSCPPEQLLRKCKYFVTPLIAVTN